MYTYNIFRTARATSSAAVAAVAVCALSVFTGCIHNDIPYPWIHANILTFQVEGQTRASAIDSTNRVVTVYIGEDIDPAAVNVSSYSVTPSASIAPENIFDSAINLTEPLEVTLSIYQDYLWTIKAVQPIERYFSVANEIGTAVIDETAHTVNFVVPDQQPLDAITVTSIKLGGPTAVITPSLLDTTTDFTSPVEVTVSEWGREQKWTIIASQSAMSVYLTSVDAWTCVAYLHGSADANVAHGFKYREAGYDDWTVVPSSAITSDGGSFTARIDHLHPESSYEAVAIGGDETSMPVTFTTGHELQMPNSQFTDWWFKDQKIWNPWSEGGVQYWDTGNRGSAIVNKNVTLPVADPDSPTGYRGAQLLSQNVILKFAAGSIYTGEYVRTDGTNGVLSFGREFTERPTRLRGQWKYKDVNITHASGEMSYMKGQPDTCIVWMALIDSPEPFEVRTNPKNRQLFDPESPDVIAYGFTQSGQSIDDFTEFTVELNYRSTSRVPRYLIIVSSASKYGDYFTGGDGSSLWINDYRLEYDY